MQIQLLPSSFDSHGGASPAQRLTCFVIDDRVTIDAGSIGIALSDAQQRTVRDVIVTHPHMDHIASLPIFVDDLFGDLHGPIRIHATKEVIELLKADVFNDTVYPKFDLLKNAHGHVMEYVPFEPGREFKVAHLTCTAITVNHIVPTIGLLISDGTTILAFSSDTAETDDFWHVVNQAPALHALFIEASFPDSMAGLAIASKHLTPATLRTELTKLKHQGMDILAVHLKPAYREKVIAELNDLNIDKLRVMEPGKVYKW
ncbi:MAG TPA: 3',5'-cyclic-nucleotide phosphodiesterase [Pyrinomonadaceae bacterium]|nr:3',5'-cyclic-nucleotide phosphodiesterase [Pyrinomonadaceae bacterium]